MGKLFLISILVVFFSISINASPFTDHFNYNYSIFQTRWEEHNSTTDCLPSCGSPGSRTITLGSALRLRVDSPLYGAYGVAFIYKDSEFENFQASFQISLIASTSFSSDYVQAGFVFRNKGNFSNAVAEPSDAYLLTIDNVNDVPYNYVTLSRFIGSNKTILSQKLIPSYSVGDVFNFTVLVQGNRITVWNTIDESQLEPSRLVFDLTDNSIRGKGGIALRARHSNGACCSSGYSTHDFNYIKVTTDTANSASLLASLTAAQVVPNFDFVLNKTAVSLVNVTYYGGENETITPTIKFYYGDELIGINNTSTIYGGNSEKYYFFFLPTEESEHLQLKAEVLHDAEGYYRTENLTEYIDVKKTRIMNLSFVYVDREIVVSPMLAWPFNAISTLDFLQKTYPIRNDGINFEGAGYVSSGATQTKWTLYLLARVVKRKAMLTSLRTGVIPEGIAGVVPSNWFDSVIGLDSGEIGYQSFVENPDTILIDEGFKTLAAHEWGHSSRLCDEYDVDLWDRQNSEFPSGCENAKNISGNFELACYPLGCITSTLEPLSGIPETNILYNFMGALPSHSFEEIRWISKESYSKLFSNFKHSTPEMHASRILVSGVYNKSSNITTFDEFYVLGGGQAHNRSDFTEGEFAFESLGNNGSVIESLKFNLPFDFLIFNGTKSEVFNSDLSAFVFVIEYNGDISSFQFKEDTTVKLQKNKTSNIPEITLLSPNGGELYSNQLFNVTWSASDADGDNLSYAVLLSPNNGSTYYTLEMDHKDAFYTINSSIFSDGSNYIATILATDGINTANASSASVFEIDNDLNVTKFDIVYSNLTERVFRIILNNTENLTLPNISWAFYSGQGNETSQYSFNLSAAESMQLFIYYNYSSSGSYAPRITFFANTKEENDSINIEVD